MRVANELVVKLPGVLIFLKMERWSGSWVTTAREALNKAKFSNFN